MKMPPFHERNRDRNRRSDFLMFESLESRVLLCGGDGGGGGLGIVASQAGGHESATGLKAGVEARMLAGPLTVGAVCTPGSVPALGAAFAVTATGLVAGTAAGVGDPRADINHDGVVDVEDLSFITNSWGQRGPVGSLPGDINGDGFVDLQDQTIVSNNWQQQVPNLALPSAVAYDWHMTLINGVWNVWAPNPADFGTTFKVSDPMALYGTDGDPQILGVHQGSTADCYFLAAAGSLALQDPAHIKSLIATDPNGGWAVTLQYFDAQQGKWLPLVVHTDNELSLSTQVVANNEVWSLVLEKAYAVARTWNGSNSVNTMASLGWGYGGTALQALGDAYNTVTYSNYSQDALFAIMQADTAAHQQLLFHTSASAPSMVVSHVYVITGVSTDTSGVHYVTTYNPWGFYETRTESDLLQNNAGILVVGNA